MCLPDQDDLAEVLGLDNLLPVVTAESVEGALTGFALRLTPGRDLAWLALAVRRALALTIPGRDDDPSRPSNADVRDELRNLAQQAEEVSRKLFHCQSAVDSTLWEHAWQRANATLSVGSVDSAELISPPDYRRLWAAAAELAWLSDFVHEAAEAMTKQGGQWRNSQQRWIRVQRGLHLAPVFEAAFGQRITLNKYPTDPRYKTPTAFMDFYCRMIIVAFGKHEITNFTEVLEDARDLHRKRPVEFGKGIIPGL